MSHQLPDIDPEETAEWLDSFDAVVDSEGRTRARFLLMKLLERALAKQVDFPATVSTPYVNTIPRDQEPWFPGDEYLERRIRAFIRWNAAVMVTRANHRSEGIGGHLATYASSASLYEVGFNHFFKARPTAAPATSSSSRAMPPRASTGGHSWRGVSPRPSSTISAKRWAGSACPSYPHPRLLPDFWEYPTVSMGLGPLCAIYQAHVNRYLLHRELVDTSASRVWAFLGDGELDEVESIGALGVASREHLDNLIFVVNCNLQRLDGPVRGNGKIIQEAEAMFRGAGWNVIKVIWGSKWDELLARDIDGVLLDKMNTTPDGEFQKYATESGAYIREHFFGPDPRLRRLVEHLSDEDLQALPRGGHDYRKLYAAYKLATEQVGQPTVILAKTIKGWTLGPEIEARNATHQIKKMTKAQLLALRNRLFLEDEIPDAALEAEQPPYFRPAPGSPAHEYLNARRKVLAGPLPSRVVRAKPTDAPAQSVFDDLAVGSGNQAVSTTMAFARLLRNLVRDPAVGRLVMPIVPDEARTFGLEPLIAEAKIYAPGGQLYTPVDSNLILRYAEDRKGQVLQEGITEAGAMASFIAGSTAYATWGQPMLPIYLFYSMFGFQRIGDLAWLLGDIRGRGILAGCTAGRTTLQGEGLQHEDGHSPLLASVNPAAHIYDPAFSYEIAVIMQEAIRRTLGPQPEDRFWYLTLYNENYPMPALRTGDAGDEVRTGILRGMYRFAGPAEVVGDDTRRRPGPQRRDAAGHASVLGAHVAGGDAGEGTARIRLGGVDRCLVRDLVLRVARAGTLSRTGQPAAPDGRAPDPVRDRGPRRRRRRRPRRGGERLHPGRARPGGALGAQAVRVVGDRRIRPLRHARRPASVLRSRRRPHRRGGPELPCPPGRGQGRRSGRCHRPLRHRRRIGRPLGRLSGPVGRRAPALPAAAARKTCPVGEDALEEGGVTR